LVLPKGKIARQRRKTPGLLAQLVEQRTLNPLVECSSHSGPTNTSLRAFPERSTRHLMRKRQVPFALWVRCQRWRKQSGDDGAICIHNCCASLGRAHEA